MMKKILIVDDEPDFCAIMKSYFTKKGYAVFVVHTLNDGLATLKNFRPDIIFLDNNMPDGNGWDAVNEIVEIIPQIRAFLVSAHRKNSPLKNVNENVIIWEKPISLVTLNSIF